MHAPLLLSCTYYTGVIDQDVEVHSEEGKAVETCPEEITTRPRSNTRTRSAGEGGGGVAARA